MADVMTSEHTPSTKTVAVIGAGTMGRGIAQVAAQRGYATCLYDPHEESLSSALSEIRRNLEKGIERGKVTETERDTCLRHLKPTTILEQSITGAELVVEAAPERMDLKQELVRRVYGASDSTPMFATNTSSLSVTEIASAAPCPAKVCGMHFFNPVHIMQLLEIVRAEQTSDETLAEVTAFGRSLGKTHIVVNDSAGFATSRLGLILGLEAMRMVEAGVASPQEIDTAMELGYRHPMGPLKLTDLVGLDVRLAIAEYLHQEIGEQFRPPQILRRLVRAGRLGKKSGHGFYQWNTSKS